MGSSTENLRLKINQSTGTHLHHIVQPYYPAANQALRNKEGLSRGMRKHEGMLPLAVVLRPLQPLCTLPTHYC